MNTFQSVIEGNSKAYMLLICLLSAAKKILQKNRLSQSLYRAEVLALHTSVYSEVSDDVHRTPCDEIDQRFCSVLANG
jgi:DNA-binding winged helix-turn-helix (wHTH) protein